MSKPLPKHLREKRDKYTWQYGGIKDWDAEAIARDAYNQAYADLLPMVEMLVGAVELYVRQDSVTDPDYDKYPDEEIDTLLIAALFAWRKITEEE